MRRTDDVFFFTLIDFLIQVFFFGLLLYVLVQVGLTLEKKKRDADQKQISELLSAAGVSNLAELTDFLTKLVPASELKETSDLVKNEGGLENIKRAIKAVAAAGGPEKVIESIEKLRKLEEGSGKPPCLFDFVDGKRKPRALGRVAITDTHIRFEKSSNDLDNVLRELGYRFADVQTLTLKEFRGIFAPIKRTHPECLYLLDARVSTELLAPLDAVWSAFQTNRRP